MKIQTFSSPIDAGNYVAGVGIVKGISLRSVDYETNVYRFSLVREDDSFAPEVNGVNPADVAPGALVDEDSAAAHVRLAIAATLPA